ncbi:MAG: ABC transporter permease subunit [Theionarchaea archaeon]|nr:ABC transporter permease subunit [Theionarchaea archaeon]
MAPSTMARKRTMNVLRHEWRVIFTNRNTAAMVTLLPLIIIGQAFVYIFVATDMIGIESLQSFLGGSLDKWVAAFPELASLSPIDQFRAFAFGQIPVYLLLVPCLVALTIATFSIVEEKQTKTLEPLLATPVRTLELMFGKSLASAIPSVLMSWVSAGFFILLTLISGSSLLLEQGLNARWVVSLFILVPIVSILSILLGVIASSRAGDARSAQNTGLVIILPVLGLVGAQLFGLMVLDAAGLLILSAIMLVGTYVTLRIAVRVFRRESILTEWQ